MIIPPPHWLQTFIDNISSYDICIQTYQDNGLTSKKIKTIPEYKGANIGLLVEQLISHEVLGYVFVKLFRASIIRKYGIRFDENIHYCEDELFVIEYLKQCRSCVTLNKISYFYTPPTSVHKYKTNYILPAFKIMSVILDIYDNKPTQEIVRLRGYQVKDFLIDQLISDGNNQKAATRLYRAFFHNNQSYTLRNRLSYYILSICGQSGAIGRQLFRLIHSTLC